MGRTTFLALSLALTAFGQARVDDAALRNAGKQGDNWMTYGFTQGETRYSPLKQIDTANVSRLGLGWSFPLGAGGGNQEATPLVHNGVIYAVTNWSVVYAIDAVTHEQRWRWDPEINQIAVRPKICCGVVNRGIALYQDMVIVPVNDGRLQALDIATGRPRWEARVAYPQDNFTLTMAPRIAGGKVIIGVAGGDRPTRGFFDAYDARTGQRAWRFYTVPGDPSKPFENEAMRKAAPTWEGEWWKMGGGAAVWDGAAYDPEADLVYVGTGNAEPWSEAARQKKRLDNLYVASILAVNLSTGQLKWHFQTTPGDEWDWDSVQHLMLAELNINGRQRKVIMQASKNGFFFVIDRVSGELLSAQAYARVNWASGFDLKTARPIENAQARYGTEPVTIYPSAGGAHNWSPMSYNPATGLVYVSASTGGSWTFAAVENFVFNPARPNQGLVTPRPEARPNDMPFIGPEPINQGRGALIAWDPVKGEPRWRQPGGGGIGGGTLSTAGNLVFQSINDGTLRAFSADKGETLWEVNTGLGGGMGPPITFTVQGKQYIALMGGLGNGTASGSPGSVTGGAPRVLVFEIDGKAELPKPPLPPPPAKPEPAKEETHN